MLLKKRYYKIEDLEGIENVRDLIRRAKKIYNRNIAYRQYESQIMETSISFAGLNDNVDALGSAMLKHGMCGKHIAVLGETSIEWITATFAALCGGSVLIPIDKELTTDTMAYQLNFSDAEYIFCSGKSLKKLRKILPMCPNIKNVIVMRGNMIPFEVDDDEYLWYEDLMDEGYRLIRTGNEEYRNIEIDNYALALLVFTSGTTGANKGVMLTHHNLAYTIKGARQLVKFESTALSVLPANHTYELTCSIIAAVCEGTTMCINDDLKHVMQNLAHFAPRMACMVPAMLELMVRKIRREVEINELTSHFEWGRKVSKILMFFGIDKTKQFFKPILSAFGGKFCKVICGGAPLSADTENFMDSIGIRIHNGYGITECSPLVAVNGDYLYRKGSVGHVLPICTVRIENANEDGNGEIVVKGDNVMLGYYKNPEDTAKVLTEDGWFYTGDIGHVDKDGFIFINGRIKNLIVLDNGKNVSPEDVEDHLQHKFPYIEECVVMENSDRTGICAICYLNAEFCKTNGLETNEQKIEYLNNDIRTYNRAVESFKRIADTYVVDTPFEKTTTHKIKRFKVSNNFAAKK